MKNAILKIATASRLYGILNNPFLRQQLDLCGLRAFSKGGGLSRVDGCISPFTSPPRPQM